MDPWPRLARARREQPVFYMPNVDMWAVTRFEDVEDMLRDTETFSSAEAIHMVNPVPDEVTIPPGCPYPELENVAQFDPPVHTRLRKLMQPGFSPKRLGHRTAEIRAIADSLIDEFIDKGRVDLVPAYSNPIPIRVMAMILGFPPEAAAKFRYWTDSFFDLLGVPGLSNERVVELWEGLLDSDEYTRELIEERRRHPADDLISDLITSVADDGSPSLTDAEITANMHAFIVAGTDTTVILLSQMVYTLLEDRDRWEQVCADRKLIGRAVEETLRFRGPIRGLNRMTTRECELGGVTIPKGARLYWMVSSANLDEAHFDAPDRFDLHRPRITDHLAFGKWTHFCIGAPLARLEARIALEQLVTRVPGMRLAQEGIEWVPNLITPAPAEVIVEWDV
ncbi:MAG TPA: cytochrome P450 [Solirubrobacteraceae bacterium]